MHKYDKQELRSLALTRRYSVLKEQGEYVGVRQIGNHIIYLYSLNNYFVEIWVIFAINTIQWIEIQTNQSVLNEYITSIDLKKELGL